MTVKIDGNGPITGVSPAGNCRLDLDPSIGTGNGSLLLYGFNGNNLYIGGVNQTIPSIVNGGISLSPTGLAASTRYFIYAYMNGTTMALEASTSGHTWQQSSGFELKTGDVSRTLVGMVYTTASSQFVDTGSNRLVLSWFNRHPKVGSIPLGGNVSTLATSLTEVEVTYRVQFLSWNGEVVRLQHTGACTATIASTVATSIFTGGVLGTGFSPAIVTGTVPTAGYHVSAATSADVLNPSDGYSFVGIAGSTGGGTATWFGNASASSIRGTLSATIQG